MSEKKIFSNRMVKSKSPRHPWTAGPSRSSVGHAEKSMVIWVVFLVPVSQRSEERSNPLEPSGPGGLYISKLTYQAACVDIHQTKATN